MRIVGLPYRALMKTLSLFERNVGLREFWNTVFDMK